MEFSPLLRYLVEPSMFPQLYRQFNFSSEELKHIQSSWVESTEFLKFQFIGKSLTDNNIHTY